ncbi:MAG: DUF1800 domain-containing protein [Saprospiraceae bacterium]|nr:DUF1800 domain-containing protein [Saprospiraceae bacterium]
MQDSTLWSLRLGFSGKQSEAIQNSGLREFLQSSFDSKYDHSEPDCLRDEPKTIVDLRSRRSQLAGMSAEEKQKLVRDSRRKSIELKGWWISKMQKEAYPLREKMVCFWHNHFVATAQKVRINYWIYQLNTIMRENAFGNFRDLTKKVITSNAMVRYLDNVDNRRGQINENLSRELLELFTLGIGNYTEEDIKNGAKALAGLGVGEMRAQYRRPFTVNEPISYLGRTGRFKAEDLIDIIFEQENIPYLITRKILQWFIYDNPPADLIEYYGNYFREVDFELKPFLVKIFIEEYPKSSAGSRIKDPLVFTLQLLDELNVEEIDPKMIALILQQQGMDLFNQPNVKGWPGGNAWLTSQIYLQRHKISDLLCSGHTIDRKLLDRKMNTGKLPLQKIQIDLNWDRNATSREIIDQLSARLLFDTDDELEESMGNILKYDFDPKSPNADTVVLRLFNYITKTAEYQLI